jgi:hypothetical protein
MQSIEFDDKPSSIVEKKYPQPSFLRFSLQSCVLKIDGSRVEIELSDEIPELGIRASPRKPA